MNNLICIVDDDEDIRSILTFALEFEGMHSVSFESARDAETYLLTLSLDSLPCLMIVDYMMPEMDGVEFIKLLRDNYPNTFAHIPIALSTGRLPDSSEGLPDNIITLEKPVDLNTFLTVAKEHYFSPQETYSLS
ncbi:MAG: response regulator [Bdellovibrionales bacterium]|nr:response regulator [Bdellovibrionales bacterium]